MSIKSITIENFKGIREPVKFDLAPITLLYGPNSAGKSTLLQALAYLNDVINHEECNNDYTRAGGTSMKLGGFMNIVNGHDPNRSIIYSIEIDDIPSWYIGGKQLGSGYKALLEEYIRDGKTIPYISRETIEDGIAVTFEISWDKKNQNAFVSRLGLSANQVNLVEMLSAEHKSKSTIQVNFDHPYFLMRNSRYIKHTNEGEKLDWNTVFDCIVNNNSVLMDVKTHAAELFNAGIIQLRSEFDENTGAGYPDYMHGYFANFRKIYEEIHAIKSQFPLYKRFLAGEGIIEASNDDDLEYLEHTKSAAWAEARNKIIEASKPIDDLPELHKDINSVFRMYFNAVINGSLEVISHFLRGIAYIGPLRIIPDIDAIRNNANLDAWHDGMAAWANIYHNADNYEPNLLSELNMYLGGKELFNTGYHVKTGNALTVKMELSGELQRLINGESDIDLDALRKQIQDVSQREKILKLQDLKRGVDVNISDVGTGISQILPIILALIIDDLDVIMVEQPELHIHPRLQVQMGELLVHSLFTKGKNNDRQKFHFIETHSEDLLLRLMRRIREPSAEGHQLKPTDLAIYYVDTVDDATRISERVQIDAEGDFIDEWPGVDGFFDESINESLGGR